MFQYIPSIIVSTAILLLFYFLFLIFQPFITALILAGIIVVLFYPLHKKINRKIPNSLAALISTLLVFIIIIVPGLLVATGIVREAIDLSQNLKPISLEKIIRHAHTIVGKIGIDLNTVVKEFAQKIAGQAGLFASHIIANIWNIIIGIFVTLLATFFFFRDGEKGIHFIKSLSLDSTWTENLLNEMIKMIKSNIVASFVSASIQGAIGGLAFAWLGLPAPILWGTIMAFFSVFPFIGSWLVWIPTAAMLILSGQTLDAVILIIIGLIVVNPVDNIIRPTIIASTTHLNGLLIFIALLGGVKAFGISGLLLGPFILILVTGLLKSKQKYIKYQK